MDEGTRDGITWVLGTLLSLCILGGLLCRFVLLPWLREHLSVPVAEVRRQVTENRHKHTPPTLPDRLERLSTDVRTLTGALDGHLDSSDRWLDHFTGALSTLNDRVARLEGPVDSLEARHAAGPHDGDRERE